MTIVQSPDQLPDDEFTKGMITNTQLLYILPTTDVVYTLSYQPLLFTPPLSDLGAALLADADLLAVSQQLVGRTGGLVALGADTTRSVEASRIKTSHSSIITTNF